jgi:Tol biopolymer transport system component
LLYLHNGTLFAALFDLDRLETTRAPVPVVEGVRGESLHGSAQFAFSQTGTLLYIPGRSSEPDSAIFWMAADGKTPPLRSTPGKYLDLRFSPDGRRLAMSLLEVNAGTADVWVYQYERDTTSRLTFGAASNSRPVWTPDGLRIAFSSDRAKRNVDVMILPMEGSETAGWKPGKPFAFLNGPRNEGLAQFSPDGRWIAYVSDETGRFEVYVRPFPGPGGKWQISTNGGLWPMWSPKGGELLYEEVRDSRIMLAAYTASGSSFQAEKPRPWASNSVSLVLNEIGGTPFDVSPDGKRLAVLLKAPDQTETATREDHLTFLFNFTDELRRRVPQGKR